MAGLMLPASPNWYLSHVSDANALGTYVFAARHDVFVFKIPTGTDCIETLGVFSGHRERVTSVALGQGSGQTEICCSTGDDCQVKLWDVKTKSELQSHKDHKVKVTAVAWSPVQSDLIVTGDERGNLISWEFSRDSRRHVQLEKDYIHCLSFCPHRASLLAIGYKSGAVLLVDVGNGFKVVHRLRGHTEEIQSLAWCPVPGEHVLSNDDQNDDDTATGFLLASGSRDKSIRIWGTSEGKQRHIRKIPTNAGYRRDCGDQNRGKIWTALCWPKSTPTQLISSCVGKDILLWDLLAEHEKQAFQVKNMRSHGRNVFSICVGGLDDHTVISLSLDRTIMFWDFASLTSKLCLPSLGGHVYNVTVSPLDPGYVAIGVGDNSIRVWNTSNKNNPFDINTIWQGIKSKVSALSWHPLKEGLLAFATDDGRVAVYDVLSSKPPKSSCTYHQRTVYVVGWGPPSNASGSQAAVSLYSVGDNKVLEHFPHAFSTEAKDISLIIETVNNTTNSPGRTDLSWKPDKSAVAIGNEDGSVDIFQALTFKHLCRIHLHYKLINCLEWHPQLTAQSPCGSPFHHWLASGASDADVHVVDLSQLFDGDMNLDQPMVITQGMRKLEAHSIRVTKLSWNPHTDGELVSAGYDSLVYVWDVKTGEAMKQYTDHIQRLLSVAWSGIDPDIVYSGGFDCTLQCWNISAAPKAVIGNRIKRKKKKRTDTSNMKVFSEVTGPAGQVSEQPNGQVVTEEQNGSATFLSQDAQEIRELQDLLDKKKQSLLQASDLQTASLGSDNQTDSAKSNVPAATNTSVLDKSERCSEDRLEKAELRERSEISDNSSDITVEDILRNYSTTDKPPRTKRRTNVKDADGREASAFVTQSKRRKDRLKSVFPASAKKENRGKLAVLEDLLVLTKIHCGTDEHNVKQLDAEDFHLGLFGDRKQAYTCLGEEGKHHLNHDNMDYYLQLEIWKGNIGGALQVARDREELTDWLVAMAPLASYDTWLSVCADYAHQLEEDGQYHKAASYLLACHKVHSAIDVFKKHKLYKEAVALAKIRLSPLDPVLEDLYIDWAQQLLKDGNYEQAAKCYLAMKNVLDAAKLLSRRSDQPTLKTAAHMTLLANEKQQGFLYAQKVIHQHIAKHEWKEAYRFLKENEMLKVLIPFVSMHELMMREMEVLTTGMFQPVNPNCYMDWGGLPDGNAVIPDFILDVSDLDPVLPWKPFLKGKHSFPHHVLRVWYGSLDVSMDTERLNMMYRTLSQLQSARQSHVDPQQLMAQVCMDLTLCLIALLLGETSSAITHLLHVVACLHNSGHFNLMQAICQLMLPPGPKYLLKLQQEVTAMRVIISMESNQIVDGSAQPVKRYLSDIKEDGHISNTGLRCRELDCLRGYYYLAVLHCLQDRCNNAVSDLVPAGVDSQIPSDSNIGCVATDDVNARSKTCSKISECQGGGDCVPNVDKPAECSSPTGAVESCSGPVPDSNSKSGKDLIEDCSHDCVVKHMDSGGASFSVQTSEQTKLCVELNHDKIIPVCQNKPNITPETSITMPKLKHLAKGLLWDIQAKKCSLTETLGYIHKAISKHLLADETKGTKSIASDRTTDVGYKGNIPPTDDPSNQNIHPSEPVPNDVSVCPPNHLMGGVSGEMSVTERRLSEDFFSVRKGSVGLSEVEVIALASAEPSPKSRKVLWEDQPHVCQSVDYSEQDSTCVFSPIKYINVPDEWYGLPVDEKYFTSYVTMGLLKEEQDYVMHELKRIPDCSQVPFPNSMSSAWQLMTLCEQSKDMSEVDKEKYTHEVVLWALHFAMTTSQRDDLHKLIKTTDGLQLGTQHGS